MEIHNRSLDVVLDELTVRRPDGREMGIDELPVTRALSSGKTVRAEEIVISQEGGPAVTTLINARPIYSDDGGIVSVVATMQDMTPLEDVARQRAGFLDMVSRALRAPLATIKGSTATVLGLPSELDQAEMLQYFEIIGDQADRMRELTNELFDVAQIDLGRLSIARQPTSLKEVVEEAIGAFENGRARERIGVDLPEILPQIYADKPRVVQVLTTLLYNASQVAPRESKIRVTALTSEGHVDVSVTNGGRGMSEEQLANVFKKFYRIDDGVGRGRIGQTGLGLAICKGIVEAHGGRIWAESEGPSHGSRFTFTIPVVTLEEVSEVAATPPRRPPMNLGVGLREQATILGVDDDPRSLRLLRNALSDTGLAPFVTTDLEEAGRIIKEEAPHLVLLGGASLRKEGFAPIKRISEIADAPVIFLSERERDQDIAIAFEMGASDYIVKPFSRNELLARIRVALSRRTASLHARPLETFVLGDLVINFAEHHVAVAGSPVQLTATEYELLFQLSTNAGRVLTHNHLLERVWGQGYSGDSRLLRTYVKYLRQKLGDDASNPKYILTEPRVGYRMAKPQN